MHSFLLYSSQFVYNIDKIIKCIPVFIREDIKINKDKPKPHNSANG